MAFNGEVAEIIPGTLGLTGSKNSAKIRSGHLLQANNVSFVGGSVSKEGGSVKYNSSVISGAPEVLGGHDWWPTAAIQRMIVLLSDGNLKKDSGAGTFPTTLAAGLSVTDCVPVFVDGGQEAAANPKKLFIFTGLNQCKVLNADGAVVADVATPPADWATSRPVCGAVHEGRMWGAAGHMLYYSLPTNHETFTGAGTGTIIVFPGVGDEICGLLPFKGVLVVFKRPKGIYVIDTSSTSINDWRPVKVNENIGTASPRSYTQIDDDVVFGTRFGTMHLLSAIKDTTLDLQSSSISATQDIDEFVRKNVNKNNVKFSQMVYYQDKREVHWTLSTLSAASNVRDIRMVLDLNDQNIMRFRVSDKDLNRSIWLRRDANGIERIATGDNSGFVWLLDDVVFSKDGAGYTGLFQTPHIDFSEIDPKLGTVNKIGKFLEIISDADNSSILTIEVYWDDVLFQTIPFLLATNGTPLGTFTLGTHALSGSKIAKKRKRMVGSGRFLSLLGKNGNAAEGFSINKMYISFKRGSESARKS